MKINNCVTKAATALLPALALVALAAPAEAAVPAKGSAPAATAPAANAPAVTPPADTPPVGCKKPAPEPGQKAVGDLVKNLPPALVAGIGSGPDCGVNGWQ